MTLGEWTQGQNNDRRDMLFLKVGTRVGSGLIMHGRLLRGERGADGDIGNTHITNDSKRLCRGGKPGCLEAVAGGWALLIEATQSAQESRTLHSAISKRGHLTLGDIGQAVIANDPLTIKLIDQRAKQ